MNSVSIGIQKMFPFIGENEIELLLSISEIKNIEVDLILLIQGTINSNVHLVMSGLL